MNHDPRESYVIRNGIMNLLSDEEVARVSTAESGVLLSEGEEYIDLERLDQGVLLAMGVVPHMGRVLPRNAVEQSTWSKILMQLSGPFVVASSENEYLTTPRNF